MTAAVASRLTRLAPTSSSLMTDEERAIPPYESPRCSPGGTERCAAASGSTSTASVSPGTTPARWPACPAARPFSPGSTPTCTASPRPTAWARCPTTRACAGCAQGEVPTLGNWFRAAGYDTHYDGKWHISHADLHDADGRRAGDQRRRRCRRPRRGAALSRRRSPCAVWLLGMGRPGAARCVAGQQRACVAIR